MVGGEGNKVKLSAVIVSRMGSSRLAGKALREVMGKPLLQHLIERVKRSRFIEDIVVATSIKMEDEAILALAKRCKVNSFAGSEDDVLDRVVKAAKSIDADVIVQINGDRPLIDPSIIDYVVERYLDEKPDFACNNLKATFPKGQVVEIFKLALLENIANSSNDPFIREHVTLAFYENPDRYKVLNVEAPAGWYMPDLRLCLDTREDLELITRICEELYPKNPYFGLDEIISLVKARPELKEINKTIRQKGARE